MPVKLEVEMNELDFMAQRMTAGQMDFATAKNVDNLLSKLVSQANNKAFQGQVTIPASDIAKVSKPDKVLSTIPQAAIAAANGSAPQ